MPTADVTRCLVLAALAVLASPAGGRDVVVEFGAGLPSESGHLQTPAGGMPGTASPGRPTLAEVGLDGGHFRWLGARVDFDRKAQGSPGAAPFHLRFDARLASVGDEATSVIAEAFTIRGGVYEAGDRVRSQVAYDGLTLALTGVFRLGPGLEAEIGPQVGWTAFDFTTDGARHRTERAYHVATVGVVGGMRKEFGNGWHLGARVAAAPAIEGTGSRYALEPWLGRVVWKRLSLAIGTRVEQFRYDDAHKQELPNRLQVTRRVVPTVSARLQVP